MARRPYFDGDVSACYDHYKRSDVIGLHHLGVSDEAEGVFDQSFADVWRKHSIDDPNFEMYLRRKERDNAYETRRKIRIACCPLPDGVEELASVEPDQFAHLEMVESRELLHRAMAHLSPVNQLIIRLFYCEELSCEELAESFNMPEDTIKSRLFRARAKLRALLEEAGLTR